MAGSSYGGSVEVAEGFVTRAGALTVQACRVAGGAGTTDLDVDTQPITGASTGAASLVRVSTPTRARAQQLADLGLDVTEHGGPGYLSVVLHGAADAAKLRDAGFQWTTAVADLTVQSRRDRAADAAFAAANAESELPSGRTTYRRLFDYSQDLKRLAREHPDLVRPITLNHRTYEGRPVEGIEITTSPGARDGKPVFLQMGAHHAREWPSAEHAMEWAYELILGYRQRRRAGAAAACAARARSSSRSSTPTASTPRARPASCRAAATAAAAAPTTRRSTSSRTRTSTGARTAACSPTPRRAPACSRRSAWPAAASTPTATTAASGAVRARPRTRRTRPTAARARSRSPRRRTCAS